MLRGMANPLPQMRSLILILLPLLFAQLAGAATSEAQILTKAAATCVNAMNTEGRKVAMAAARLGRQCVDAEARGKEPDADACIANDAKGAVAKALGKAVAQDAKKCAAAPPFAYADSATRNDAARGEAEALLRDALDGGAGLAVLAQAADKTGAKCQKMVATALDKVVATTLAEFNKCKKKALKTVTGGDELRDQCFALLTADRANPKGKIAKAAANLEKQRAKHCATTDLAAAFPGRCAAESGPAFAACLDQRAACRSCRVLDAMDALSASCDLYDDGVANTSCAAAVPAFEIAIGDTVSDGVPAPGAGNIETPGSADVYVFDAAAGTTIFFDEQAAFVPTGPPYSVTDEDGLVVAAQNLGGSEPGRIVLTRGGRYTITVGDAGEIATGTYQFQLWAVPADDVFAIAIGDTVSDGVPAAGAGNIEVPGARDVYTFTATAGDVVFVDELTAVGTTLIDYVITGPLGAVVASDFLGAGDPGAITLDDTGTYTITVGEDDVDATGTYSFALSATPPDDVFAIAIGDTVSDGVPAAGAGNIEFPGGRDVYTFTANAGDVIFLDETFTAPSVVLLDYAITDPLGGVVLNNSLGASDPPAFTASLTGTYTIAIGDPLDDAAGTYAFTLHAVPADDTFAIALGDSVADGVPAAGAGNIEVPASFDVYTFSATAGDVVFLDETTISGGALLLDYRILDPLGGVVLTNALGASDPGAFTAPSTGTYTIRVGDLGDDASGTYAFTLHLVPADDEFAIAVGDTVSSGVPAAGAGNIEVPSARDVYTFAGTAGQVLVLDELGTAGTLLLDYRILDPLGATVLTNALGGSDPAPLPLASSGTYTIVVGDDFDDAVGTYSFSIAYQ